MSRPSRRRLVVRIATPAFAIALLFGLVAPPTFAEPPSSQPDSHQQPLVDGCQRSNAMDLTLSTPEWVYVNRSDVLAARLAGDTTAGRQTVEGVVDSIHPAGDDLYINHNYNDLDIGVQPDPQYMNLVASGNGGDLGTEWEATLMPTWAWPQVGDRV